jgi:hypothetical protein
VDGNVDLDAIGSTLGLKLKAEVARATKVGGSDYQTAITDDERARINQLTADGRGLFSYLE